MVINKNISLSIHTPEQPTAANMNKVRYTINLEKSYVAKKKRKHKSTTTPLPHCDSHSASFRPLLFCFTRKGPSCLTHFGLGQPSTRSFGSWRAINRKIFKNDKEMAPLGLKPNSPDYRSRNCTSSKWDLNPYVPFIMQRRTR